MGAKEDFSFRKPRIEVIVPFQLPKGKSSADPKKVEADDIAIHVVGMLVRGDTDTIDVLGQSPEGMS